MEQRDPDCLNILQNITLIYYIDDTMLTRLDEQEMVSALEFLVTHMYGRRQKMKPINIYGFSVSIQFLGVQESRACWYIFSKV